MGIRFRYMRLFMAMLHNSVKSTVSCWTAFNHINLSTSISRCLKSGLRKAPSCKLCWLFPMQLQSQTKIVGTVNVNPFFSFPVLPFSLPMLFIAIQSANRVHQHWEEKKTQKRPNNFDCDCSLLNAKSISSTSSAEFLEGCSSMYKATSTFSLPLSLHILDGRPYSLTPLKNNRRTVSTLLLFEQLRKTIKQGYQSIAPSVKAKYQVMHILRLKSAHKRHYGFAPVEAHR